jgi:hypothetical protein
MINTTKGLLDEAALARTLGVEDRPDRLVVWVEYRSDGELVRRDAFPLPTERGPLVYTTRGDVPFDTLIRTIEVTDGPAEIAVAICWREAGGELVRRDAHVILKHPTAEAAAIAAALG